MRKLKKRTVHRVLIVYKKSSYEDKALDKKDPHYLKLLRERHRATIKSKQIHDVHIDTLETIKRHLHTLKIPYDISLRTDLGPITNLAKKYDLILTIGGDGTFLETSHFMKGGVMMGINSVPDESVGFFCKANSTTFLEKLYQYLKNTKPLTLLHRLVISVDGKEVPYLALNDVLFANANPAGTTRYILKVGRIQEEQKSSGLWVSPAPGSTAATGSAGGRSLPIESTKFQYVVREPYIPRGRRYALLRGILPQKQKIEISSMMDDAYLFIDGPHICYPVPRGAKIVVKPAMKPIQTIG